MGVKTINLSIPEETWRRARIEAARHDMSLSALVRGYLNALACGKATVISEDSADDADQAQREELAAVLGDCKLVMGYRPSRAKTYER